MFAASSSRFTPDTQSRASSRFLLHDRLRVAAGLRLARRRRRCCRRAELVASFSEAVPPSSTGRRTNSTSAERVAVVARAAGVVADSERVADGRRAGDRDLQPLTVIGWPACTRSVPAPLTEYVRGVDELDGRPWCADSGCVASTTSPAEIVPVPVFACAAAMRIGAAAAICAGSVISTSMPFGRAAASGAS